MDGTAVMGVPEAGMRLPEHQREALELRERERLSYEEIAAALGTSRDSVAQLIWRARINLYDELRGTALASVAAPPECGRALPLIAEREDGQLGAASNGDAAWLDAHLAGCERCRRAVEQMGEAVTAYRADAAVAEPDAAPVAEAEGESAMQAPPAHSPAPRRGGPARRRTAFAAAAAGALLLGGLVAALVGDGGAAAPGPGAEAAAGSSAGEPSHGAGAGEQPRARSRKAARKRNAAGGKSSKRGTRSNGTATGQAGAGTTVLTPVVGGLPIADEGGGAPSESASGPNRSSGKTAVGTTRQTSSPKSKSPSTTAQASQPQPASEPAPPTTESTPTAEEPTAEHGHRGEPPGKPADRPPR